jgi:DinB superfamily
MSGLPEWTTRLIGEFTASDARAEAIARTLSSDRLNWKPRPDAWSIGQCLAHLAAGNELYLDAIEAALTRDLNTDPVQDVTLGAFSRWFLHAYIEPSPGTKRARSPSRIRPAAEVDPGTLDRFLRSNERARALLRRAAGYDVNRVRFRNPFVPVIRFTVGTGFVILSAHERRHLLQAQRINDLMRAAVK